jgi:hypothetical protein
MPERLNHGNNPRWRIVKPIPPLMIPKRVLTESFETNRTKSVMKNTKITQNDSVNDTKDSYKILLLIRELALSQEREEVLHASVSKEKEENMKIKMDFSKTTQELKELIKKEQSLSHQLRESSKIISHYEKEISALRDNKPVAEKTSIGVGTDNVNLQNDQVKNIHLKVHEKNQSDLDHFLKLCRQNEMSISVAVDQSERLDTISSTSESQISLSDQKIQVLNECHQVQLISECVQTETPKKMENIGIQTERVTESKVEATPEYFKFIMNNYADKESSMPILPQISVNKEVHENSTTSHDRLKISHKTPCFKTSPKNSICTCSKKSDSKSTNESSSHGLFLLQDETSMLVPLQDLLAELETSYRVNDTLQIYDDSIHIVENDDIGDLSNLIQVLNKRY